MAVTNASGSVNVNLNLKLTIPAGTAGHISEEDFADIISQSNVYQNGTAANAIDIYMSSALSLAGAPTTLDLYAVTDIAGNARVPLRCRELWAMVPDLTLTHIVNVAPGAANGWTSAPTTIIYPGGAWYRLVSDPISVGAAGAVIATGNKTIKFDPGALTVAMQLIGLFCSAAS
jgi:hypothetical protein